MATRPATRRATALRWILRVASYLAVSVATLVPAVMLVGAFQSRGLPDLQAWHTESLEEEFRAGSRDSVRTFGDYLKLEERLYAEMDRRVLGTVESQAYRLNRYDRTSASYPGRFGRDWNRSYELRVDAPRGGVLLLHGLTDSPYSMRAIAEVFHARGYYVLVPRLPGHGTTPGSLRRARWQDWSAVVRLAVDRIRRTVGADAEFLLGGYSNGGTLAVQYTLDALEDSSLDSPDGLYLFSPAIGVTRFAAVAGWHRLLTRIPYFEKYRWLSVRPEYDPFKYNSFPKIAGHQTWSLTRVVQQQLDRLSNGDDLEAFPPLLAFQSLVDSTIRTESLVRQLFDRLPGARNELVLFDVNRIDVLEGFMGRPHTRFLERLESDPQLRYGVTLITNHDEATRDVVERVRRDGRPMSRGRALDLAWPEQIYSMSHVAIPFSPEDALYGAEPPTPGSDELHLGHLSPRGEKGVLIVPVQQFLRLRFNPFFPYIERRLIESIGTDPSVHEPPVPQVGHHQDPQLGAPVAKTAVVLFPHAIELFAAEKLRAGRPLQDQLAGVVADLAA